MTSTLFFLLCLGLCLSQRIRAQEGPLPKPNLSIQKDFIRVSRGNVTFRCNISDDDLPPQKWTYLLFKDGNSKPLYEKTTEASWVEFSLLFDPTQDFGNYSCKYFASQNPQMESEASAVLEISEKEHLPASAQPVLECGREHLPCSKFDELDEYVTISVKNHSHHHLLNHYSLPLFIGLLLSSTLLY
ncbi:T-cell-interacting, activating receptor on myeloid cells protein 1-like [Antechinus flavipes]|uniref:T-cell-interacting, activating receptor on myeloid cells protein 1-like n=1 Tax=Antechinus flavipes TaxID=38775 RepID=UPI002236279A|nr:T-cell-interacting, activating receptor on myeloid cells protein 1-like [Antechinus flavipes]